MFRPMTPVVQEGVRLMHAEREADEARAFQQMLMEQQFANQQQMYQTQLSDQERIYGERREHQFEDHARLNRLNQELDNERPFLWGYNPDDLFGPDGQLKLLTPPTDYVHTGKTTAEDVFGPGAVGSRNPEQLALLKLMMSQNAASLRMGGPGSGGTWYPIDAVPVDSLQLYAMNRRLQYDENGEPVAVLLDKDDNYAQDWVTAHPSEVDVGERKAAVYKGAESLLSEKYSTDPLMAERQIELMMQLLDSPEGIAEDMILNMSSEDSRLLGERWARSYLNDLKTARSDIFDNVDFSKYTGEDPFFEAYGQERGMGDLMNAMVDRGVFTRSRGKAPGRLGFLQSAQERDIPFDLANELYEQYTRKAGFDLEAHPYEPNYPWMEPDEAYRAHLDWKMGIPHDRDSLYLGEEPDLSDWIMDIDRIFSNPAYYRHMR